MENPVQIKVYDSPQQFYEQVAPFLTKDKAMNSLMLRLGQNFAKNIPSIEADVADGCKGGCVFLTAAFVADACVAAVMLSKPSPKTCNMIVTETADANVVAALSSTVLEAYTKDGVQPSALLGETSTVERYAEVFIKKGFSTEPMMEQGIYRCREVIAPKANPALGFRQAAKSDQKQLPEWLTAFAAEVMPGSESEVDGEELFERKLAAGELFVLEKKTSEDHSNTKSDSAQLVAMVASPQGLPTTRFVNWVYTPPSLRRRGYGSYVTASLSQYLLDEGMEELHLYTDMANPTSNKIYQEIGYQLVGHSRMLGLKVDGR